MYNTTDAFSITKDKVLKKISEYDIFALYLGFKPIVGNLYRSPLRADTNPSFGLFRARGTSNLLYKDLGTGESGDCFKLVASLQGITARKAIKQIYNDIVTKKVSYTKTKVIPIKEYNELDIVLDTIDFTVEGYTFWREFGITPSTLEKFNVKQIKRFWVNSVEKWVASKSKPMFAYLLYSKVKIYRPFYKQMKFYTNCTGIDIQGWEQLDYFKDTVFITKSYKDVMLLHELGYTAIAPNGEGHSIPEKALKILRDNFKKIIVLYDRDLPGLKAARKLCSENRDFEFMFMPRRTEKDLSDYFKAFGKEKTLKIISDEKQKNKIL
jgi:hypothetical protein